MVQLITAAGVLGRSYDYDAFGNGVSPSAIDTNPFRYAGQYFDRETGTYYLRARYYDPGIGRFTQRDPLGAGSNWYIYCLNNPIQFIDPSGLVEVGLREYAATYEGSTVSWDPSTGTATVTWGKHTLRVKSTADNNRNGRIYVDDSLFVNAFGIGGKVIVYQDSVTQNISIRASFDFKGDDPYTRYVGSEFAYPQFGITYSSAFLKGIEEYWSGTFGEYNVSTYARYHGDGIKVYFKDAMGTPRVISAFWHPSKRPGIMFMYGGAMGPTGIETGKILTIDEYKWVAAHEFGHILGVRDAYDSAASSHITSIFNGLGTGVQPDDIAKILRAQTTGRKQDWP